MIRELLQNADRVPYVVFFRDIAEFNRFEERFFDVEGRIGDIVGMVEEAVEFFKEYGEKYKFDWLMIGALAYQESRIDQNKRSPAGAIGVMQLLPSTAKDPNVNIPDIENLDKNIHAGVKYLRFINDRYFEKEPMDHLNLCGFIPRGLPRRRLLVLGFNTPLLAAG